MTSSDTAAFAPAVILFGPPGSGKGTQSKWLRQECLEGPHISTGDMLRTHIESGDVIGRETERLIKSGHLVSDDLVNELVEKRLQQLDCRKGVILDGYPRTLNQAHVLLQFMERFRFRPAVIHLVVNDERIVARLSGRRQCPVCGTLYSLKTNPPKVPGICDLDGAPLVLREDDRESVIRARLDEYESQTRPLLDFFRGALVPVFSLKGADRQPEEIAGEICEELARSGVIERSGGVKAGIPNAGVRS